MCSTSPENGSGEALRVLSHHLRNKILLLAAMVAGVSDGMKDQCAVGNSVDVGGREQLDKSKR